MKKLLCYIDHMGRGGAQRVMCVLIRYFSEQGYEVVLVNDYKRDEALPHYDVPDAVKRIYLRNTIKGNPISKNMKRIAALRKAVKKEKPDLVLSFLGAPNMRMLIATIGVDVGKVVSVRNDPKREYGTGKIKRWLVNQLFRKADGVVFQTGDAKLYFDPAIGKRSRIIMNPVGDEFYQYDRSTCPHGIIALSRFEPQKNLKMMIDAFADIADDFPEETLTIYGAGYLHEEIERYCKTKGLPGRIMLPGNIPNVGEKLADAKLYLLTSDYEGMPNALMEALAVGTPAIATDCPCGGVRALVQNGKEGFLVPCGDTKALAEAMRKLLSDEALQAEMSKAGKQKAEIFRSDTICRKWEEYFAKIC